jgi:hypothetical protein
VTFFFWGCLKATFTAVSPKQKKLKENIRREDANIRTEQLQRVSGPLPPE